jgi:AraC-like DNA-binding protein
MPSTHFLTCLKLNKFYMKAVLTARDLIRDNPGKHYTAGELAYIVGAGSSQLKKAFKQYTGAGIYAYQLQQRLMHARELVAEGEHTLKAIAKKSGFKQLSNFTTAFKKQFGITPGKFRALSW